jgi:DNA-binding MarR family transcriptional regulator
VSTDLHADAVSALAHEMVRHVRLLHVVKTGLAATTPNGLEGAEIALLMQLVKCGPRRQGELADLAMLDPSTVSRYVGQLARRGLVERRPDPADGRAVQLVATERGHDTAHAMIDRRNSALRQVLAGWSESDLRTFTALFTRLNDDVDAGRAAFTPDPPDPPDGDPSHDAHASDAGSTGVSLKEN